MSQDSGKTNIQSNIKILEFAMRQWRLLIGVVLVSGILGVVFSGPKFIPPKFTSNAVIYPANLGVYGSETELEQLQQYLESNAIRDTLIKKFKLYEEYEIDQDMPNSKAFMNDLFAENVVFRETRFESVEITATSIDPEKAKRMVDEIIHQLNQVIRNTQREKYWEVVVINKQLMDEKRAQVDSLQELIAEYATKYGLLDYTAQSVEVTEGYMKLLVAGKKGRDFDLAMELYENLQKHGRRFHNLHAQLNEINDEYLKRLHDYEESLKNYRKIQTYSSVLISPEVSDKKSYPIRWLIVLLAVTTASLFTFTLLLMLGYHKS